MHLVHALDVACAVFLLGFQTYLGVVEFGGLDVLKMFHRHLQNVSLLQLGLIQPEGSDDGFLELIQAVVYPLSTFPLDERFSQLSFLFGGGMFPHVVRHG